MNRKFLELLSDIRLNKAKPLQQENEYYITLHYASFLGLFSHILFLLMFTLLGFKYLALLNVLSCIMWLTTAHLIYKGIYRTAQILATIEIVTHACIATVFLGWYSGFHYYFISIICFSFFTSYWNRIKQILSNVFLFLLYCALSIYSHNNIPIENVSSPILYFFNIMNTFAAIVMLSICAFFFRKSANDYFKKLTEANEKLNLIAATDPLTGLYNRRGLTKAAAMLLIKQKQFVIAICDIDDFKLFNEQYGHDCGDVVLKSLAVVIENTLSNKGIIGRWGGEEFLIILPEAEGREAAIENLRKRVENNKVYYNGQVLSVTLTFGYTIFNRGETLTDAINRADRALRSGKSRSKNCVVEEIV